MPFIIIKRKKKHFIIASNRIYELMTQCIVSMAVSIGLSDLFFRDDKHPVSVDFFMLILFKNAVCEIASLSASPHGLSNVCERILLSGKMFDLYAQ